MGFAKALATGLLVNGVDVAYSYEPRRASHFPHAFATRSSSSTTTTRAEFPYPIVPMAVNCYGEHVIARHGRITPFADINAGEDLDPPGPTPRRCFEFGRAVARPRETRLRVALVASSSWSHAFLHDKGWHMWPDTDADLGLFDALVAGDDDTWRAGPAERSSTPGSTRC